MPAREREKMQQKSQSEGADYTVNSGNLCRFRFNDRVEAPMVLAGSIDDSVKTPLCAEHPPSHRAPLKRRIPYSIFVLFSLFVTLQSGCTYDRVDSPPTVSPPSFEAHIQAVGFEGLNPVISGMAPFTVHVNALASALSADNQSTNDLSWNFGDSSESSDYNDMQGFNASHTYNEPGSYTLVLTIITSGGETVQRSIVVTIEQDSRSRIYVSSHGNDSNTGTTEADPVRTLPRAAQLARQLLDSIQERGSI